MNGVSDILFSNNPKLHTDDAKLYRATSTIHQCDLLQDDLTKWENLFSQWQLKITIEFREVVHLGYNNPKYDYSLGGASLSDKSECEDSGIVVSYDTKIRKHCTVIVRNASI